MKDLAKFLIGAAVAFALGYLLIGCAGIPQSQMPAIPHPVPPNLAPEGNILTFTFGLGIGGIVAGIVLYFLIPEQHRISYSLIGGGGAGLALDLFLKPALWFLPYIYLAVAVLGVLVLAWEIWTHYIKKGSVA